MKMTLQALNKALTKKYPEFSGFTPAQTARSYEGALNIDGRSIDVYVNFVQLEELSPAEMLKFADSILGEVMARHAH